jgi:hypothetical protein
VGLALAKLARRSFGIRGDFNRLDIWNKVLRDRDMFKTGIEGRNVGVMRSTYLRSLRERYISSYKIPIGSSRLIREIEVIPHLIIVWCRYGVIV